MKRTRKKSPPPTEAATPIGEPDTFQPFEPPDPPDGDVAPTPAAAEVAPVPPQFDAPEPPAAPPPSLKRAEVGIACPKCGCSHAPVAYTRHAFGRTIRRRDCRHCGHRFTTTEKPPAPPP